MVSIENSPENDSLEPFSEPAAAPAAESVRMSGFEEGVVPQPPADALPPPSVGYAQFPQPAPKKKHTKVIVGTTVVAVVVVAVAVSVALAGGKSSSGDSAAATATTPAADLTPAATFTGAQASTVASLIAAAVGTPAASTPAATPSVAETHVAVPASAGGLTQITGSAGEKVTSAMENADASTPDLTDAEFAAYSKTGSSTYFGNLTLVQLAETPDLYEQYESNGADATLTAAGAGSALSEPVDVNVTTPGAAMYCGLVSSGSVTLRTCVWVDGLEFGTLALPSSTSDDQVSAYAEAVWHASETS